MKATLSPARYGRVRFRWTFSFNSTWNKQRYRSKQIDVFAVKMSYGWFVITVVVKYF